MPVLGSNLPLGDFTILGFSRDPGLIEERLSARIGITPHIIKIGSVGQFFYYSSYADFAESEEAIVLKLGFLRSTTKSPLNANQLLAQKLVGPHSINYDAFSGNGLVVGLSKTEPAFAAFQTLMSVPQLYYSVSNDGILCSDVLRCLVRLIPHIEIDDAMLPQHFLFRSVHGSFTYYRGVERLLPGQFFKWSGARLETRLVRTLDAVSDEAQFIRDDVRALNILAESFEAVVGDYTTQIEGKGQGLVNLLSGGVDSTLLQYFINAKSTQRPLRSVSYGIQVPAFKFEIDYAQQASQLMHTEHTFVNYTPQDYPGLLTRAIDILAQPPNLEMEPSLLAIAEFVQAANWPERYFFTAFSADSLFGEAYDKKLKGLEMIRNIPFSATLLRGMGRVLAPVTARSQTLLKGADIIASENNPDSYISPSNTVYINVFGETWEVVRRWFGDKALREALAYRRNLAAQYSQSRHYLDKVHFIDFLTFTYEVAIQDQQLSLAYCTEQIHPFYDEDLMKVALTFHPDMRFIKGFRSKHLLKRLLEQKTKAPVARMRKGGSTVNEDMIAWMRSGPLRPLVDDIQLPDFMTKTDFNGLLQKPNYFLWSVLTLDVLKKRLLGNLNRSPISLDTLALNA